MRKLPSLCVLFCCLSFGSALAETTATNTSASAPPDKAALEAALSACAASAGKDSSGNINQAAMDSCMTGKGFTRPSGPPPGGKGNPPPNQSN